MENKDFTKEFFQKAWGPEGYMERFSYGVGIKKVCEICMRPFFDKKKTALEIGPGGGAFTELLQGEFKYLTAIDVIKQPKQFLKYRNFTFIELNNQDFNCTGVPDNSIDFAFSYNVFCHFSNDAIAQYLKGVHRVLKQGGDFVFMLSNFEHSKKHFMDEADNYVLGDILPTGHFYKNMETVDIVTSANQWTVVYSNMIPEHRDIIVHLRKK